MPEYNNTIRLGHKGVSKPQDAIPNLSSSTGKPSAAQLIHLVTLTGEAQDAGIQSVTLRRQYEKEEIICACRLEAKVTYCSTAERDIPKAC